MKKILLSVFCLVSLIQTKTFAFSDVFQEDWHYPYITTMSEGGFIYGYPDDTFRPEEDMTIAELCVLFANAYYGNSLTLIDQTEFSQWWEKYVYTNQMRGGLEDTVLGNAVTTQINSGYRFIQWSSYVNESLSRYDAAMMIYNLLQDQYISAPDNCVDYLSPYTDVDSSSPYAMAVATCGYYNLLHGNVEGAFQGENILSRAESAVIIYALTNFEQLRLETRFESWDVLESPAYQMSDYDYTGNLVLENYVFARVNELRSSMGLHTLTSNDTLVEYAYIRAQEAEVHWAHQRPDGSSWSTVISPEDTSNILTGENLTMGAGFEPYEYADMIFKSWLNSPGHYANMISENHQELGLAVYITEGGEYYAAQIFGKPAVTVEELFPEYDSFFNVTPVTVEDLFPDYHSFFNVAPVTTGKTF